MQAIEIIAIDICSILLELRDKRFFRSRWGSPSIAFSMPRRC
jgi:hypothetical protein